MHNVFQLVLLYHIMLWNLNSSLSTESAQMIASILLLQCKISHLTCISQVISHLPWIRKRWLTAFISCGPASLSIFLASVIKIFLKSKPHKDKSLLKIIQCFLFLLRSSLSTRCCHEILHYLAWSISSLLCSFPAWRTLILS